MDKETSGFHGALLIVFIACKLVGGMYLSTWSWWWVLAPIIPIIGSIIHGVL